MKDLFTPSYMFGTYDEITPQFLDENGIRYLLIDIDNTLAPYEQDEPDERIISWFAALSACGIKAALVSNNHEARVRRFNQSLGLTAFWDSGKPQKKALLRAMEALGADPKQTAMLGDQLLTDSFAARHIGLPSIIVPPIRDKRNLFFRFKRFCERPFIRRYARAHGYSEWLSFWKVKP